VAPAAEIRAQLRAAATADSYARLPRLDLPTLLLHGGADILVLPENSRLLALRIPRARLRIVPGAGHALVQERPALVGALLRDFAAHHD
jgi:pimeloyl-ACP methyl ester carboxylesterase